jgi:hypothetical protein
MSEQPTDLKDRQAHRLQRELLTCKHFNGALGPGLKDQGRCCKAGVAYRKHVGGELTGWLRRLPCTPRPVGAEDARVVPCALREFPTVEEVEREEAETEAALNITMTAIKLCSEAAGGRRGVSGDVECPKCGGRLDWVTSAYNGHLHGKCRTDNCISWMQ